MSSAQDWFLEYKKKIEKKIQHDPASTCVIWTGSLKSPPYGGINVSWFPNIPRDEFTPTKFYVHRVAYRIHHGVLDLGDLSVSHLCHRCLCVNPVHLTLEPTSVNNKRKVCQRLGHCTHHLDRPDCIFE